MAGSLADWGDYKTVWEHPTSRAWRTLVGKSVDTLIGRFRRLPLLKPVTLRSKLLIVLLLAASALLGLVVAADGRNTTGYQGPTVVPSASVMKLTHSIPSTPVQYPWGTPP